ncbi:ABC transporter ATP-binding protein [Pontibacter brevis]
MSTAIKVENLSKQYRLGEVGTGTISHDLNRWWHKIRGKEDPYLKIGDINDRTTKGTSDYVWALRDINFEVQQGEVLGIIGKNGAGKSTLLKLLSRVASPTIGSIKAKGRIASLLEVGTGFNDQLTGRENVFLNGAILGMTKAEIRSKFDEIVAFSGTERYIDTPVKRYSSGMRVRLAFAVAAHLESEILIVDEVLAVGDVDFQRKAIGKMQNVSKSEGRTVLFVSHNMASIKSLCNSGLLLKNGTNDYIGGIEETIKKYFSYNDITSRYQSIAQRTDRTGSQQILFSKIEMMNEYGLQTDTFYSGDKVTIHVYYKVNSSIKDKRIYFSLQIKDSYENIVASFINDEMGVYFNRINDNNCFKIQIPSFLLRSGEYYLKLTLTHTNTAPENFIDSIDNVSYFSVAESDFWKSGKINRSGNYCIIPAEIENNLIENSND